MQQKYSDILNKYGQEVDQMNDLFLQCKANPKISKGKPPVAGAIAWSEAIFKRVQRPILKFKDHPGLLESEEGKKICRKFFQLGREIRKVHHVDLTGRWEKDSTATAMTSLTNYILKEEEENRYVVQFDPNL